MGITLHISSSYKRLSGIPIRTRRQNTDRVIVSLLCLVRGSGGRIAQCDQLSRPEGFLRKLRIGVDDKNVAAENARDYKASTLDDDYLVFLVEETAWQGRSRTAGHSTA